jgi:hypothetical protein
MLVQLTFPSKSGKSIQRAVYEFSDCRSLETAVATLKATKARKAHKSTTLFTVINSHTGPIYRWDSHSNKFINERKQDTRAYVEMKKAEYKRTKDNKINAMIVEFFDTIEEFVILHKPMQQLVKV